LENSRRLLQETSERDESNELVEIAPEVNATRSSFTKEAAAAKAAIAGSPRPEDLWDLEVHWKNRVSRAQNGNRLSLLKPDASTRI
jgi:hypothetical protein